MYSSNPEMNKLVQEVLSEHPYIRIASIPADLIKEKKSGYTWYRYEEGNVVLFINGLFYADAWGAIYAVYHNLEIIPYVKQQIQLIEIGIKNMTGTTMPAQKKKFLKKKLKAVYSRHKLLEESEKNLFQINESMIEKLKDEMDFVDILLFAKAKKLSPNFLVDIDLISSDFKEQLDRLKAIELAAGINELIAETKSKKSTKTETTPAEKIPTTDLLKAILNDLEIASKQKAAYVACAKILIDDEFKFQHTSSDNIIELIRTEFGVDVSKNTINDCRRGENYTFTDSYKKLTAELARKQP